MTLSLNPIFSSESFQAQIEQEFVVGSGVALDLYDSTVSVVCDTEQLHGGEVVYPIHEALNWRVARFGHQARTSLQAALILNEDGSCWQAKLGFFA